MFVQYHDLLADPAQIAALIAPQLTDEMPARNESSEREVLSLIEPELRHHVAEPEELHHPEAFYPWLWEAYEACCALVDRPAAKEPQHRLDRVRTLFDPAAASFAPLLAAREIELAERDAKISVLDRTLTEHEAKAATLDQALAERKREIGALQSTVSERDKKIYVLGQTLAEREAEIAKIDQLLAERDREFGTLRTALSERDATVAAFQSTVAEMRASTSWRVTAPLRFARRLRDGSIADARGETSSRNILPLQPPPSSDTVAHPTVPRAYWKIKNALKRVLGPRLSATLSRALAAIRFHRRKFADPQGGMEIAQGQSADVYQSVYMTNALSAIGAHSPLYGARATKAPPADRCDVQLIAYYLPQFHPIPENDQWWGVGFTEWRNVTRAFPVFAGHEQPHLPGELGYYDLRVPSVLRQQVELARLHGISVFCFHFYWFGGKRLLELPLENFWQNKELDLKFCLCWANENWTRRWDGADQEILLGQSHSAEDDVAFIRYIKKYFDDPRYLKIDDKPVLTVYRPSILPDAKATVRRWRREAERLGLPGLYLIATNSFGFAQFEEFEFDALSEFPPHGIDARQDNNIVALHPDHDGKVFSYSETLQRTKTERNSAAPSRGSVLPGTMPAWDNTPRLPLRGHVFQGSTPALFYDWLTFSIARAQKNRKNERFVVINAWNEWAEGAYLEPDRNTGYARLAACAAAVADSVKIDSRVADLFERQRERFKVEQRRAVAIHLYYEDLAAWFSKKIKDFSGVDVYLTVPKTIDWETAQAVVKNFNSAYILDVENRGRDIRPFLTMFPRFASRDYEFVCKLHSKKSPHLNYGDQWRENIVDQLLSAAARKALDRYQSRPSVGLLAARGSLESLEDPSIRLRSEKNMAGLADRLNCKINLADRFIAGSMFWFRPAALTGLYRLFADGLEFEPELGQVDGTLAHAIERIFCIAAKAAGMSTHEFGEVPISRPSRWA